MYRIDRNNYHLKPKFSNIQTPLEVSEFIFNLLSPYFPDRSQIILDPGCGAGNLSKPWKKAGYKTLGIDIVPLLPPNLSQNFLTWDGWDFFGYHVHPQLVLCNPPFNGMKPKLAPEIWLDKIIELFGPKMPIVLFAPIGLRICNSLKGKRYQKFITGKYPSISSIITLPRTIFPGVEFHAEILIFNLPKLQPHYFYHAI
ncbi:MAG: putative N6 adenine-specific DNA methyltransferase [Mycoplasmataceae bacterium RV_VA103A]|nr:MAG: putative N6 adenine-specific DNA methyltransferase [Mycoplasmataceae bacterium RV_VA103A]